MVLGGILAIVRVIFLFKIRFSVKKKKRFRKYFFYGNYHLKTI